MKARRNGYRLAVIRSRSCSLDHLVGVQRQIGRHRKAGAFAVFMLITNSKRVGSSTGKSPDFGTP